MSFELIAPHEPAGDQPTAIASLIKGIKDGKTHQTLFGATGTGKTFTVANVILFILFITGGFLLLSL
jgi:excinuclease ABC subunit B